METAVKVVILAGGLGSRLSEETAVKPKPMVEVGGKPILWHVMKIYEAHGLNDFIICLGYKGYMIKEFFANFSLHSSNVTFDFATNTIEMRRQATETWRVTLVDTGETTSTAGRLRRVRDYLPEDEPFCFTYSDGVADIDLRACIDFHHSHDKLVTVTAVQPPGRFGVLDLEGDAVCGFHEKPKGDGGWINGGFFVVSPKAMDFIDSDQSSWEYAVLPQIAAAGQLRAFKHNGFWYAMDTVRDKMMLDDRWHEGRAEWKIW